ncbi:MAG: hypothetical protein AAF626_01865 [Pseudomonadota bacterium]
MSFLELIGVVGGTFAMIIAVAWVVLRHELRREEPPRPRSHHEDAYGKSRQYRPPETMGGRRGGTQDFDSAGGD